MPPTSFINERTAELVLVPELIEILKPFYSNVTPLFYWVSREGGKMSRNSFEGKYVKLLVLYARRPKVIQAGTGIIQIKLNNILFERARLFAMHNIPVIAGFPLADKLEMICKGMDCSWIKINSEGSETTLDVIIDGKLISPPTDTLSSYDIPRLVESSTTFTWNEAIEKINQVRRSHVTEGKYLPFYGNGDLYKPIYLLVHMN